MCIAAAGKIINITKGQAVVQYSDEQRTVLTAGIPVELGDMVQVQMGIVIKNLGKNTN